MSVNIGNVCIDTNELARASTFWRSVTGYEISSSDQTTVYMQDPDQHGPGLSLQLVPEPRVGKNRLHIDLFTDDLDTEIDRVKHLGGSEVARFTDDGWVVMADLDGNQFCLVGS
jgi:predicted enzyme related to lactoylglutathione lyase